MYVTLGAVISCARSADQTEALRAAKQEILTLKKQLREAEADNEKKETLLEQGRAKCAEVEAELAHEKAAAELRDRPAAQKVERAARALTLPLKLTTAGAGVASAPAAP